MLRLCCSSSKTMVSSFPRLLPSKTTQASVRLASSGGGVGAGTKIFGTTLVISAGTVGGAVGYSAVDPDFRKMVEETIPGSDQLMELVLGEKESSAPPPKALPSKLKISSPVMITKPQVEVKPPAAALDVPAPPIEVPSTVEADVALPIAEETSLEEAITIEVKAKEAPTEVAPVTELVTPIEKAAPIEEVAPIVEAAPIEEVAPIVEAALIEKAASIEEVAPIVEEAPIEKVAPIEELTPVEEAAPIEKVSPVEEVAPIEVAALIEAPAADIIPDIENTSLEVVLVELCKEMQEVVASAVTEYEASSNAVVAHISLMQKVLESNLTVKDDSTWNEMFVAAQAKSDKAKAAEMREKEAILAIANVVESISAGRKNKVTSTHPELVVAEEAANRAIYKLDQAKARRAAIQSEARVMEEYRDLVEEGREQFHKEMASIMPDVKLGEKNGKLTEDELNMFITHAYKKVLFLQQEVAKQQTLEQERFKKALEKQRVETETLAMEQVGAEMEKQKRELHVEHEKKMADIKNVAEGELRAQLKRQAAAHTDHLTDVLNVQEAELTRHHKHGLAEQVDSLTSTQVTSLASLSGTVSGLSAALQARAGSDSASLTAQALWLACSSLNTTMNTGRKDASTWEEKLQPLVKEIKQVKTVAGPDDEFVDIVLASISPLALERGVYTEDSLKERFCVVEKNARRVAGIGEEGGSLLAYGLSFLQSLLVVDLSQRTPVETMEVVDLASVSATDLVTMAKHSLERGNLARAVQLMTQLKGEPGRVVNDWVTEARLTLETRQAVEAVLVHSLANSCKYMPGV
eukprot:GFUD01022454.1.p1 GENE.GFUD01022454.1~~GFUD01022454.1.p1  ORF type:complete len:807 (-),score=363.31 GFUD01022454.1:251-2671(-)